MRPNMELKARMLNAAIPNGVWQSFLTCKSPEAVDRLVSLAQKRIAEWSEMGVIPEVIEPDRQIVEWGDRIKALF
jgi:hypothetical protein